MNFLVLASQATHSFAFSQSVHIRGIKKPFRNTIFIYWLIIKLLNIIPNRKLGEGEGLKSGGGGVNL